MLEYRILWHNPKLASKVFRSPKGKGIDSVVREFTDCFVWQLERAQLTPSPNVVLVFEGTSEKSEHRARQRAARRAKRLNAAIRRAYRPGYDAAHRRVAEKVISSNMGRPSLWFSDLVAKELKTRNWTTVVCPDYVQADSYILYRATEIVRNSLETHVVVWSVDRDFLALDATDSVSSIRFFKGGTPREISKADVLDECSCTSSQLRDAYCYSGCDDISVKVHGLGFITALKLAKAGENALDDVSGEDAETIRHDIKKIESHVKEVPERMRAGIQVPSETPSMLDLFLDEKHNGVPRRPQLAIKARAMLEGKMGLPGQQDEATLVPLNERILEKKKRIREKNKKDAEKRTKVNFFLPTYNIFAVLADLQDNDDAIGR